MRVLSCRGSVNQRIIKLNGSTDDDDMVVVTADGDSVGSVT